MSAEDTAGKGVSPRSTSMSRLRGRHPVGREGEQHADNRRSQDHELKPVQKCHSVPILKSFHEAPSFLQGNRHVLTGYRVYYSWRLCLRSLLHIHNDLAASLIFAGLFYPIIQTLDNPTTTDIVLFAVYIGCAVSAMLGSAAFHLFGCTSLEAYKWLATLDYSGITLLIVGSYLPLTYWGFHCVPFWRDIYMGTVLAFGVTGMSLSWIPYFSLPNKRFLRSSFYLLFGWFSLVPVAHLTYIDGTIEFVWRVGRFVLLMGIIYSVGAAFYISQVPERWAPGQFDYGCQSHVIWHLLVFMAAMVQLWALVYCHKILPERSCPTSAMPPPQADSELVLYPTSIVS